MGATPQQLQAPIHSHVPMAEAGSLSPCVGYRLHGCSASFPAHPEPGKISASPNPHPLWTTRDSEPCRELWDGNLCFPVCGLTLELLLGLGKERGTGGSTPCRGMSPQHPWEWQLPSQAGPPSPLQQEAAPGVQGKEGIRSPGKGGFEGSVARNPPSHSINVRRLWKALSAAGKAR